MKFVASMILGVFLSCIVNGQYCPCPNKGRFSTDAVTATRVFSYSNGKIGTCGYIETDNKDTIYSEFALYSCEADTIFKEWSALDECKIRFKRDTVIVDKLYRLPFGNNLEYARKPFYRSLFFYDHYELIETSFFLNDISKYTSKQINTVLEKYKQLKKGNNEHTIDVADMLFWAYVSGSAKAESLLIGIERNFGPFDGHVAEDWDRIIGTYTLWKQKNK